MAMPVTTPSNPTIEKYRNFYEHPFIQSIAFNKRWTVSDTNKMPIDMYLLKYENRITGALCKNETSLMSLPDTLSLIPEPSNHAYYLNAVEDGFVVVDIEPKCPEKWKNRFLQLPYIYGEYSMSGKGYHLVFPLPDCIEEYPAAQIKTALKEAKGRYEILMNHYVTFTRNMLPPATGNLEFEKLFRDMASKAEITTTNGFALSDNNRPDIPKQDEILALMFRIKLNKTLDDYDGDYSKMEFGYGGRLLNKLDKILKNPIYRDTEYTNDQKAWLMYTVMKENLPHRSKHDTMRGPLPWLLYIAEQVIAKHD